jgi:hypothetical protein
VEYFRVERLVVDGKRSSETLASGTDTGLCYLFAADGAGRLVGSDFEPLDLPARGIVAVPANSPTFVVEDLGGLELIRIAPNWPAK